MEEKEKVIVLMKTELGEMDERISYPIGVYGINQRSKAAVKIMFLAKARVEEMGYDTEIKQYHLGGPLQRIAVGFEGEEYYESFWTKEVDDESK